MMRGGGSASPPLPKHKIYFHNWDFQPEKAPCSSWLDIQEIVETPVFGNGVHFWWFGGILESREIPHLIHSVPEQVKDFLHLLSEHIMTASKTELWIQAAWWENSHQIFCLFCINCAFLASGTYREKVKSHKGKWNNFKGKWSISGWKWEDFSLKSSLTPCPALKALQEKPKWVQGWRNEWKIWEMPEWQLRKQITSALIFPSSLGVSFGHPHCWTASAKWWAEGSKGKNLPPFLAEKCSCVAKSREWNANWGGRTEISPDCSGNSPNFFSVVFHGGEREDTNCSRKQWQGVLLPPDLSSCFLWLQWGSVPCFTAF